MGSGTRRRKSAADPADSGDKSAADPADSGDKSAADPADSGDKSGSKGRARVELGLRRTCRRLVGEIA
jgi:hypothetical protein